MDVWRLALAVAGREPLFVQIGLGLGVALALVLFLEGLYASLRPLSYGARIARNRGARFVFDSRIDAREHAAVPGPDRPAGHPPMDLECAAAMAAAKKKNTDPKLRR